MFLMMSQSSCRKDNFENSSSAKLRFSTDTVVFDTIFTTVGSITKRLVVHNDYDDKLNVSNIRIAGDAPGVYKMNVDGEFGNDQSNIEIRGKDSIYIFLEALIDPSNANDPFVLEDFVVFNTNGNVQEVNLQAWGQNAHYYYKNNADTFLRSDGDTALLSHYLIDEDTQWSNDKPHLLFNTVIVRDGATLTIQEGARVYLRSKVNLIVHDGGKLKIEGNPGEDNRVLITGDRLDDYYKDLPGHWGRIWLCQDAGESSISNADIRNGTSGIYLGGPYIAEAFNTGLTPKLTIDQTVVTNMLRHGLLFQSAEANVDNSEISDCGEMNLFAYIGGDYTFRHCTFANYFGGRKSPALVLTNYVTDEQLDIDFHRDLSVEVHNSIIYGGFQSELALDDDEVNQFDYSFNYCLMRMDEDDFDLDDASIYNSCLFNEAPSFIKKYESRRSDYQLDTLSSAQNIADPTISVLLQNDLLNNVRWLDDGPDMGAYERID
jgi:hypothetical protein